MSTVRRTRPTLIAAIVVAAVVALLVTLLATRSTGDRARESAPIVGKVAPPINGAVVLGEPFDITASEGWVVVNFFATWCGPCVTEHPQLDAFEQEHREIGDARVISVVYDEEPAKVEKFFADRGGDWTVFDSDEGRTAFAWGVTGVPESYLVAPNGTVVERIRGGVTRFELNDLIDAWDARWRGDDATTTAPSKEAGS